jgi:ribosomal protein L24
VLRVKAQVGDKVRVKSGSHAGERGVIAAIEGDTFMVRLEGSGQSVRLGPESVTNFSLAARKAWVTGPNRAVGRRKGTKLSDRVSVTLRIDRELWERFRAMEESGTIADRTAVINGLFREKLAELERQEH